MRFPLNSLSENVIKTSGIVKCPAIVRAFKKFLNTSFLVWLTGICDPVKMTVLAKFWNMNDNADAV